MIRRRALVTFILLGLTSLTADMVYEGARSVGGAYIESLGGSPIASAIVSSGDLIGYGLRFLSGLLASMYLSSQVLWGLTIAGYVLTTATLPLLAFSGTWQIATLLYLLERVGKGLRTPARDVILAEVTESIGRGKGFGLHELMDQSGAVLGPLIVAILLALHGYSAAFLSLLIPGILSIIFVVSANKLYSEIESIRIASPKISFRGLGQRFWIYTVAMILFSLGYVHWMIISYYLRYMNIVSDPEIALAYLVAMLTDAVVAYPIGYVYDKIKYNSLYIAPLSALLSLALLVSSKSSLHVYYASALWGVAMGCYETIMRASIADLVEPSKRALAYGVFGLLFGISWTIGAFIFSIIIWSSAIVLLYVSVLQITSVILVTYLSRIR